MLAFAAHKIVIGTQYILKKKKFKFLLLEDRVD